MEAGQAGAEERPAGEELSIPDCGRSYRKERPVGGEPGHGQGPRRADPEVADAASRRWSAAYQFGHARLESARAVRRSGAVITAPARGFTLPCNWGTAFPEKL